MNPRRRPTRLQRAATAWLAALAVALPATLTTHPASAQPRATHALLQDCAVPYRDECLDRLEQRQRTAGAVRREGDALWLPGSPSPWVNTPGGARYWGLGPLAPTELHLLALRTGDQPTQFMLAGPGALPVVLKAPAWPAPAGRLMAVADEGSAQRGGSVLLLGLVDGRWRQLWRFDASDGMGFEVQRWRSDSASVRLGWHCRDGHHGVVLLRDGPYGWDWLAAPPACR